MWKECFTVKGRLGRKSFFKYNALTLIGEVTVGLVLILLIVFLKWIGLPLPDSLFDLIFYCVATVFFMTQFCLVVRRIHDHDKSAWWLLPQFLVPISIITSVEIYTDKAESSFYWFGPEIQIVCFVILLWFHIELSFLRGTVGSNRFGPDPITFE